VPDFNKQELPDFEIPQPPGKAKPPEIKGRTSLTKILITFVLLIILCAIAYFIVRFPKKEVKSPPVETATETYSLRKNELLANALLRCGVSQPLAQRAVSVLQNCRFDFRKCKTGDTIRIVKEFTKNDSGVNNEGVIRRIEYQMNYDQIYEIHFDWMKTSVAMAVKEFEVRAELVRGAISSSLYESLIAIGERGDLGFNFADILGWEIDFFVETQEGDSFFILVDKKYDDSELVDYGKIQLVRYKGKIGDFYGIFFEDPKGHRDYYDLEGKSTRKAFLRSPLRYSRISSYFSGARHHPILRIVRPHRGIDYVAPRGTPVAAVGDGTVTFAGWKGGYGRLVEIAHGNGYKSRYGHLSGFGGGIRTGRRVAQGQKVGYVGSTGLSTGPHLHFELLRQGSWVNPLRIIPPRAEPVRTEYLEMFYQVRDQLLKQFSDINL
jgi:murein DD-endopeptidase MepM/ murein hydrolase activator NlpD